MNRTVYNILVTPLKAPCPECDGHGWTVGVDYEDRCCGGSDWECGARGCTGPIQEQVQVQEQCEHCLGTGVTRPPSGNPNQ